MAQPNPQNVFVQGRYAYVVNDDAGGVYRLNIFDVSDPQYPISVGIVQTSSSPSEVFVAGRYAYVIASNRLNIFDVSNVSNPVAVSSLAVSAGIGTDVTYPSRRPSIYVSGKRAYITDGSGATVSFTVVDISNPTKPSIISAIPLGSSLTDVFVSGRYAYVTNWSLVTSNNFYILDVSTSTPSILSFTNSLFVDGSGTDGGPFAVSVQGRYAYVANQLTNKFSVIDISNPASPTVMKALSLASGGSVWPIGISVSGKYAYLANNNEQSYSVSVIDVASSSNPFEITKISLVTAARPSDVFTSGRYLYVTEEGSNKLTIIDIKGIETNGIMAGAAEFGSMQVRGSGFVNNDFTVAGSLNVGIGGILTNGVLTVSGAGDVYVLEYC